MIMMTTQYKKPYPIIKVTLLFGSIGIVIGLILATFGFVMEQREIYNWEHYGVLMQRDKIPPFLLFLIPTILISPYFLIIGAILAYKKITWQGKRWVNKQVYLTLMKYSRIIFLSIFIPLFLFNFSFERLGELLTSGIVIYIISFILTVILAGFFLPKGEI